MVALHLITGVNIWLIKSLYWWHSLVSVGCFWIRLCYSILPVSDAVMNFLCCAIPVTLPWNLFVVRAAAPSVFFLAQFFHKALVLFKWLSTVENMSPPVNLFVFIKEVVCWECFSSAASFPWCLTKSSSALKQNLASIISWDMWKTSVLFLLPYSKLPTLQNLFYCLFFQISSSVFYVFPNSICCQRNVFYFVTILFSMSYFSHFYHSRKKKWSSGIRLFVFRCYVTSLKRDF